MKDNKKKKSLDDLKEKDIKTLTPEEQKKLKGGDDEDGGGSGGPPIKFP
jgi:hypothetical protein